MTTPAGGARTNREGRRDFDVEWDWDESRRRPGLTAVVRARDEVRCLPWSLPPLLAAVHRVVLVDNGSQDDTAGAAREIADALDARHLDLRAYPFEVAPAGAAHLETPADSVHSLTYFYNWAFASAHTSHVLKWDADMVLTDPGVTAVRELTWQLEGVEAIAFLPRHPLYVDSPELAWFDAAFANHEQWLWPHRRGYTFDKGVDFELSPFPAHARRVNLPHHLCIELKHLDTDEFSNWSTRDFRHRRNKRKAREWQVFRSLVEGSVPDGLVAIEAPAGTHVVQHVRETWLPARARAAAGS